MEINFNGKKALVTGAGRGIGREIVKILLESGASVVALSRTQANLDSLKWEYPEVECVCVDLSNWKETEKALRPYAESIDLLVNNAAYARCVPLEEVTEEMMDQHYAINVKGAVNVTRIVVEGMKKRKYGAIVNNSSIASLFGLVDHLAYGASKGALDTITKVLAAELGPFNIRVNSVNPTVTWTEMAMAGWSDEAKRTRMMDKIPLHRFAEPKEVAQTIVFLLSDKASMLSGVILPVDGGQTNTSCPP
ncbi:PREDICTED: L-xylulose reductase-like [Rhagoletis zephyria]|uniref:L-xylulose reductase-like n=1 Tax=Rhagoletis zephyria TaxID=28612 RepID=UPI0008116071|nr:PREDICTED: L-xylulose reductase-like [Rhagoletis zephyria]KAH9406450.1 hypothetical protein TYRP_013428 [Tyrophagus putrescentiae]